MQRSPKLPSPALAISLIALFVALGGSGYAAVKINGKNIKNKSISGKKLKNRTITRTKVERNSLTGAELNESKLGKVPTAATADTAGAATTAQRANFATSAGDATTVDGYRVTTFRGDVATGSSGTPLVSIGGMSVTFDCSATDNSILTAAKTAAGGAFIGVQGGDDALGAFDEGNSFSSATKLTPIGDDGVEGAGQATIGFENGDITTVLFGYDDDRTAANPSGCQAFGQVISR